MEAESQCNQDATCVGITKNPGGQFQLKKSITGTQAGAGYNCYQKSNTPPASVQGCTDSGAGNYDQTATEDDGSCVASAPPPACDGLTDQATCVAAGCTFTPDDFSHFKDAWTGAEICSDMSSASDMCDPGWIHSDGDGEMNKCNQKTTCPGNDLAMERAIGLCEKGGQAGSYDGCECECFDGYTYNTVDGGCDQNMCSGYFINLVGSSTDTNVIKNCPAVVDQGNYQIPLGGTCTYDCRDGYHKNYGDSQSCSGSYAEPVALDRNYPDDLCIQNECGAGPLPTGYHSNTATPQTQTTATGLGAISCDQSVGWSPTIPGVEPTATCTTNGSFVFTGCQENTCGTVSEGYVVDNLDATTVAGLGTISCAAEWAQEDSGVEPTATCSTDGPFNFTGCHEKTCRAGPLPDGYVAETPTATTVAGLGTISCDDTTKMLPGQTVVSTSRVNKFRETYPSTPPTVTCGNDGGFTFEGCHLTYHTPVIQDHKCRGSTTGNEVTCAGTCGLASAYNACLDLGGSCVGFAYHTGGHGWQLYDAINPVPTTETAAHGWNCYGK